jgi:hypothetical protein
MLTTGAVDYIGVTFSSNFDEHRLTPWVGDWKDAGHASEGYQRRQVSQLGADLVSEGEDRLGKHFRIPGECWQAMRDEDMATEVLPGYLLDLGGKPTRLDLCVNMHEADSSVDLLYELATLKQVRTRARSLKRYQSSAEYGFYVGSKGSDKYARVYDKRLQQGMAAAPRWVRVEIQMRKRYAVLMTSSYAFAQNKRSFINRAIQDYLDFPTNDEFQQAISDQDGELPTLYRKPPKFVRWLEKQVIPAMLNYQDQHEGADILRMFSLMYHEAYTRRKGQ